MKKRMRTIISFAGGIIVGGMCVVGANQAISAVLNDQIKVKLNGIEQAFKDETTGERQYPITYKDRTYLPLRTVANLVGVGVDYDANTNSALLTSGKENLVYDAFSANFKNRILNLPYINIDSEDAKKVNEEISVFVKDLEGEIEEFNKTGTYVGFVEPKYDYYVK